MIYHHKYTQPLGTLPSIRSKHRLFEFKARVAPAEPALLPVLKVSSHDLLYMVLHHIAVVQHPIYRQLVGAYHHHRTKRH